MSQEPSVLDADVGEASGAAPAELVGAVLACDEFGQRARSAGVGDGPVVFGHVAAPAWPMVVAAVARANPGRRLWVVCPDVKVQERVHAELETWGAGGRFLPESETQQFVDAVADPEIEAERLAVLHALAKAGAAPGRPIVLVADSFGEDVPAPAALHEREERVARGDRLDLPRFLADLERSGYERLPLVTERGQVSVRGGIVDVFSWQAAGPVRIELFDDVVESVRAFDADSQTTVRRLDGCDILFERAARDDVRWCKLTSYVGADDLVVVVGAADLEALPVPPAVVVTEGDGDLRTDEEDFATACHDSPVSGFEAGDFILQEAKRQTFLKQLEEWRAAGWRVAMFFNNAGEASRFHELVREHGWGELAGAVEIFLGPLSGGFTVPAASLAVLTDAEIFGRYQHLRGRRRFARDRRQANVRAASGSISDFAHGDHVVHLDYGIARYRGVVQREAPDGEQLEDALALEFADGAKLFVPLPHAHLVSRYIGAGNRLPLLSKLGDGRWTRARKAAEESILDYAAQLLSIQAERESLPGFAHPADTHWQVEFENAFIFRETADQLRAIEDTKRDMETPRPMDRLVCGDVGFGKTEVAVRAAFKAVMGGKQVAVLVPTTVLAQQHYETFRERMSDYPVTIEVLSRFRSPRQQRDVVRRLATGEVDIVVGTHRLISPDVRFKNLGLAVIDEEQRFGVKHKERFKERFRLIDVLTLSATPIPRTLYLSLMGARDMSTIDTPPPNRIPVQTTIAPYDERAVRTAIDREHKRGGQVFFLHNRVKTIGRMAERVRELCPGLRVDVGHGQMDDGELEEVMHRFVRGETDVLLCTTIIESGVDIPNANTIIIDRADRFGLADLYQLRGRVGRAGTKAYALLLLPRDLVAAGDARKRINAIKQYSALGSGFKIAMRDLEIRGAGNLLGTRQSGHIAAVGFDLYCKLLRQSIGSLKGKGSGMRADVALHLEGVSTNESAFLAARDPTAPAFIPASYMPTPELRIAAYRDLAAATSAKSLNAIVRTWRDRFGPPPPAADNLLRCTELKVAAATAGITAVEVRGDKLMLSRNHDYIMVAGRFPRLQSKDPAERLREAVSMVKAI